jgi:hypothetical protein
LTLAVIDRTAIPATTRGGSRTRLPEADQKALRAAATSGDCVSDGNLYGTAKEARIAGGPARRFLRNLVKDGDATGKVRSRTWADGKKYRWAVELAA